MVVRPMAEWLVLRQDQYPAYISWAQYEENRARLRANRARADARGVVRNGAALLAGLVVCGRCGARMLVRYGGSQQHQSYVCTRHAADYAAPSCQHLAGPCLEQWVSTQVLAALEPAALELSLEAAAHLERDRADLAQLWQQRRERAAYEAERAARHYRAVEPENRLVARQLARDWEDKLAVQQQLEEEYHRYLQTQSRLLTAGERDAIRHLAANIPALWAAPTTTATERKEIIRQVVERVVVAVQGESEQVAVIIAWAGGARTEGMLIRPVARLEQLSYYPQLCQRVQALATAGASAAAIAAQLNSDGFRPPKRHEQFGAQGVRDLLLWLGARPTPVPVQDRQDLGEDEWWLADLARTLRIPPVTLYCWLTRGEVRARRQQVHHRVRWIVWADAAERVRLRQRHQRPAGAAAHETWVQGTLCDT
jgi:hypothetical protein